MPRYKIEATVQLRRIYEVEAASMDEAEELAQTCDSSSMIHEEDISEEIDSVEEIKAADAA
jgi:hypothetical protein